MWQPVVPSVIHMHCFYPLQFSKLSRGNTWNTTEYLLMDSEQQEWPPKPSGHHSPALCLDYGEVQETDTTNLLTGTNSTVLFLLLWKLTAPLPHFWFCCTYIFCHLQCQDDNFIYLVLFCSQSTLTAEILSVAVVSSSVREFSLFVMKYGSLNFLLRAVVYGHSPQLRRKQVLPK